ncbi:MAG: right-handed parallel beta-helix repeat-containing protein, partial [Clostridia bacterium]|nr:right-handed parallel beta-helix repeat-containing protein [Clostridia bacterium]
MRTRFLSLLTAVLLAAGIIFLTGCDNTQPENTISAEALAERFGGYTIVRPDSASDGEVSAAVYLRSAFEENGYTISITTDWVNRGEEVPADTPEILVGQTNRAETLRYAADLRQGEFAVAREGNRYVLTGGSEDAVQSACAWFVQFALGWDGEGLYEGGDLFTQKKTYRVDSPTIGGNVLREYSILYTDAVNNEEEAALGLQQTILEETGWLLPAKKISIAEVDKERYDRQILLQADKTMEEGYKITLQDGKMAITGSDRIQLQGAVMALRKEMEESSMTYENGTILEGKLTRQSLTLYADPGARTGGDGSASAPFATGDEIMAGILAKASEDPYDITVQMKGGDYRISRTMTLDAAGVGVLGSTVQFVCEDENEARFCAWVPVTGFAETTVNGVTVWAADLPRVRGEVLYPNQCFSVSGQRLERPRYPEGEEELMAQLVDRTISSVQWNESMNMFGYRDETIETFSRPEDIQIHMFHYWNDERLEIGSIDTAGNRITTKTNSSMAFIEYTKGAPYYFDNVYEMLKKPGQFYVDKKENKLLYIPQAGEKIDECTLYASDIDVILTIDGFHGTAETPALSFRNIGFVGSDWKSTTRATSQAASDIHGAVRVNNSSHIIFDNCTFTGIGNYALEIQNGVSHLEVTHCTFRDIGAGGITIYGVNTVPVTDEVNHDLTITDNYIGSYGRVH